MMESMADDGLSDDTATADHPAAEAEDKARASCGAPPSVTVTTSRSPWFHHWFSKPLSTVIMAADRAPKSRVLPVSRSRSCDGFGPGEKVETMVGLVANAEMSW